MTMSKMPLLEKFLVNSRIYALVYRHTALKWFLDFCDLRGNCLEIGCGNGVTTQEILKRFDVSVTAIDIDEEEIEMAKKRLKEVKLVQADAMALPFENSSFDCVIELSTFHHVKDYQKALREVYRVLKKGGSFFMFDVGQHFFFSLFMITRHFEANFTKEDMLNGMKKAGFKVVKEKGGDIFMIHVKK